MYVNQLKDNIKSSINHDNECYKLSSLIGDNTKVYVTFNFINGLFILENDNITTLETYLDNIITSKIVVPNTSKRITEPTPNNPDSSRSHAFIDIKFIHTDEKHNTNEKHIIVCDLAGVENEFECDSNKNFPEILKFIDKYNINFNYNENKNFHFPQSEKIKLMNH